MLKLLSLITLFGLAASQVYGPGNRTAFQQNDIDALNYALTLENLEYFFYYQASEVFTAQNFTDAGYSSTDYDYIFTLILQHEMTHVTQLTTIIQALGGVAAVQCEYHFPYSDVKSFLSVAALLETTGASAYDGAINTITDPTYVEAAATIATVEARHSAFLNQLNGTSPFPNAFEPALAPAVVLATVLANFVTNDCSNNVGNIIVAPKVANASLDSRLAPNNQTQADANDIAVLQFALTLEHLEATFYRTGLSNFTAEDFNTAGYNASVYTYFQTVAAHEAAHVAYLVAALGNIAYPECQYNFNFSAGVEAFVNNARVFENTGVSAYDGAVNGITNSAYRQAAATIATIEGRHASYLNQLTGMVPFPNTFDPTLTPIEVFNAVSPFFVSCPYDLEATVLPVVAMFSNATLISGSVAVSSTSPSTTGPNTSGAMSTSASAATTGGSSTTASASTTSRATTSRATTAQEDSSAGKMMMSFFAVALALFML